MKLFLSLRAEPDTIEDLLLRAREVICDRRWLLARQPRKFGLGDHIERVVNQIMQGYPIIFGLEYLLQQLLPHDAYGLPGPLASHA